MQTLHNTPTSQILLLTLFCGSISCFSFSDKIKNFGLNKFHNFIFIAILIAIDFVSSAYLFNTLFCSIIESSWNNFLTFNYYRFVDFPNRPSLITGLFNGTEPQALFGVCLLVLFLLFPWPKRKWFHIIPKVLGITLASLPHLTLIALMIFGIGWLVMGNQRLAFLVAPIGIPLGALLKFDYCISYPPPLAPTSGFYMTSACFGYSASWASLGLWTVFSLLIIYSERTTLHEMIQGNLKTHWTRNNTRFKV
jgi:membrane-bound metal-dependent hydrolase YbcI (DUF457 family)